MTRDEALAQLTAPGQPYELAVETVRGRPQKVFVNAPANLGQMYAQTASDLTFLVYEDQRLSFAQTQALAGRLAGALARDYGVGQGDRVAISLRNYPEWVIAFQAVTRMGAVAVAMNAHWQPEEMAYGLKDCGARVLFADRERLQRFDEGCVDLDVSVIAVRADGVSPRARNFQAVLDEAPDGFSDADVNPDDDAIIYYTSGSTGWPKGVVSSHRNILSALLSWELDGRSMALIQGVEPPVPAEQPATLLAVPLFHVTGSHAVFLASYRAQRRLVSMYKWDPAAAAELIERERITSVTAPAAMTGDLVREAHNSNRDLSSLQTVGGGGAPRAPEQVKQIEGAFGKALPGTGWGMTETNAIGSWITGQDYLGRPASSGRCSAVLELKVVDDDGRTLGPNQRGELLVRGTSVFRGYWNRDDLNATLFEDGWFRTGDVAYLDEEGFVFIVDRIKDLIIRGGENIGCGQVEAALLTHPLIHEAAVYAVPDERLGEEVGATVHGDAGLDTEEVQAYLAHHLARFEIPRYITVAAEPLPRTASGKILKRELRDVAVRRLGLTRA